MSTLKTKVTSEEVLDFLQKIFDKSLISVNFIKGGEMSQAFSYVSRKNQYVIRINAKSYSFEKDQYAYKHFANKSIPIPKILKIGKFNEKYFFAVSEAKGKNLENFSHDIQLKLLPQLISILNEIHKSKIDVNRKYGRWDRKGIATFNSWKDYILNCKDEIYSNWDKLYKETMLEKAIVEQIYKKIKDLIRYLLEERWLVHGDYGFSNVVSDGEKITGVLDWGESLYGDFVYDVAWLDFWSSTIKYGDIFKKHYQDQNIKIPNYNERLLCYQLHLGLGNLSFFALSHQKESYLWSKNRLLSLLGSKLL